MNHDDKQNELLAEAVSFGHALTAYENPDVFDTADAVVAGEYEVEFFEPNRLEDDELQWYAQELRRVCGDDVACEELSAVAVEIYL